MKNLKQWIGLFLVMFATMCAFAGQHTCDVCGKTFGGDYWYHPNEYLGTTNIFCKDCSVLPNRCFTCGIRVLPDTKPLPDGRYLCPRHAKEVITSDDEAKQICAEVVSDLNHLFARWMDFPTTNALVSMANRLYLQNLIMTQGVRDSCASVYGATVSNPMPDGTVIHSVAILNSITKAQLMATCAHEFTHAFVGQYHIREKRKPRMSKDMEEAFCELVSHKYMEMKGETVEMRHIEINNYTQGKIAVLLAADQKYGFNAVLDWIKNGDEASLEMEHLERIRAVNGAYVPPADLTYEIPVATAARAVAQTAPSRLILKSISGGNNRRFAMINSTTFETMEKARVSIGNTNVSVQCLEIDKDSVTIKIDGAAAPQKLQLAGE